MKSLVLALLLCSTAQAKEFTFTYHFPYGTQLNKFVLKQEGSDYEEAYKKASFKCLDHYLDIVRLNEETKLDIVDTCANPR